MTQNTIIAVPNTAAAFTGHCGYRVGARRVHLLDRRGRAVAYVLRSQLPADFGPDMKSGAFGMADAFNAAKPRQVASPAVQKKVQAIRDWATRNYEQGGDLIVECLTDAEIASKFTSLADAKKYCGLIDGVRADIQGA